MRRLIAVLVTAVIGLTFLLHLDSLSAAETIKYKYDARGRLIAVERSGTVNNNVKSTYGYDRANNRVSVTTTGR